MQESNEELSKKVCKKEASNQARVYAIKVTRNWQVCMQENQQGTGKYVGKKGSKELGKKDCKNNGKEVGKKVSKEGSKELGCCLVLYYVPYIVCNVYMVCNVYYVPYMVCSLHSMQEKQQRSRRERLQEKQQGTREETI